MLPGVENVVLFLHLVGVLLFVAGIVLAGAAFEAARRRERVEEIALQLSLTRVGAKFVAFGGLLLFAAGMWLVELADVGFGTGWVSAAMALFIVAVVLGGLGGQRPKQARELATRLAEDGGPGSAELRALLDDRGSRLANYASSALILVVLALMVFKP
jgi:uncharacterized membrane protein